VIYLAIDSGHYRCYQYYRISEKINASLQNIKNNKKKFERKWMLENWWLRKKEIHLLGSTPKNVLIYSLLQKKLKKSHNHIIYFDERYYRYWVQVIGVFLILKPSIVLIMLSIVLPILLIFNKRTFKVRFRKSVLLLFLVSAMQPGSVHHRTIYPYIPTHLAIWIAFVLVCVCVCVCGLTGWCPLCSEKVLH